MKFHHIGIACDNIPHHLEQIEKLQGIIYRSDIVFDPHQHAHVCLVETKDGAWIELIAGEKVAPLLHKGISYYHICYTTAALDDDCAALVKKGALLISPPQPAPLFSSQRVAFLYCSYGVIELLEEKG